MVNLDKITQELYEDFEMKELWKSAKYLLATAIVVTGWYVGSNMLKDAAKEARLNAIVNEAKVIELAEPALGYMQTFKAEGMNEPGLFKHYKAKILELNPRFDYDITIRKAPDLNNDGKVGN